MFRNVILVLTAVLAGFGASAPPSDTDAWVARAMKEFDVPGVALAVIKDGKPVLVRGYGVRKLGDSAAVDANTLFGIASNSKAFTATALAILVDEGKISWDDPVQKHLPTFATWDPWVSREVTIRDLLCHRIGLGLGAGDLLFWPDTDVTREQVVSATRWIRPTTSFRSKYAYNNLAFVVAGEVVRAVSGKPWDQFVRERIFTPVGMSGSQITTLGFRPGDNVAAPHSRGWRLEGALTPIPATTAMRPCVATSKGPAVTEPPSSAAFPTATSMSGEVKYVSQCGGASGRCRSQAAPTSCPPSLYMV